MEHYGKNIMKQIRDNIIDDHDTIMLDKKRSSLEDKYLKPYKKIRRDHLMHFASEVVSLAAWADREDGVVDKISVTSGPVYHFFDQATLDAFLARAEAIIEAARL